MPNPQSDTPVFATFRWPKTAVARFVALRTTRVAAFWALVFGGLVASKAIGYATVYPTALQRNKLAASIGGNLGFNALFGTPHHVNTTAGYTAWYTLAVMVLFGSIWALLLAAKTLRGEEDAGRWEVLLCGQTTPRRATANTLAGLSVALVVMYVVVAAAFVATGRLHSVDFSTSAGLFLALSAVSGAVLFMAIGAVAAQLMPTRMQAAGLGIVIFGVCFAIRAGADTTNLHWLLNVTPLGWIEKTQPLYGSQAVWLIPVALLTLAAGTLAIYLAGKRDLGDSIVPDKDTARPHFELLNSPLGLAVRMKWAIMVGWLTIVAVMATFFGLLAKLAGKLFGQAASSHKFDKLAHAQGSLGTLAFIGIIFFIVMMLIMAFVANAAGAMREDEAEGYLDNLLTRRVGRLQWLIGRVAIAVGGIVLAGLVAALTTWLAVESQHLSVSFGKLFLAGVNAMTPALFALGLSVLAFGFVPRLTTLVAYGLIAWSFLINIISSGINLNHWIADTSVFNHLAFAPATNPKWAQAITLVALGTLFVLLGVWRFRHRDIEIS